jgi:hypothetical protein
MNGLPTDNSDIDGSNLKRFDANAVDESPHNVPENSDAED